MLKLVPAGLALTLMQATALSAQTYQIVDARVAAAQPAQFVIPLCPMRLDSKVNNAQRALRAGMEEPAADKKAKNMMDSFRMLGEALAEGPSNGAAWYYLGRWHLLRGDMAGLDSAWTRAEALLPDCEPDISSYRQNAWAVLTNTGIEKQNGGDLDSAKVFYARANRVFKRLPHAYMNLGVIYANEGKSDSAAVFFQNAVTATEGDTTMVEERKAVLLNLGAMHQRLGDHRKAVNTFGIYAKENPSDAEVLRHMAASYRRLEMVDSAEAIEKTVIQNLSTTDLDQLETQDLLAIGVGFFNAGDYPKAADAFKRVVAKNPYDRDGHYNLANAYLAMKDGPNLTTASEALREIEPMNEDVLKLIGQGLSMSGNREADLLKVAEELVALPVTVAITRVSFTPTEARASGTITGRAPLTPAGRAIPPAPQTLTFEFLDIVGNVVGTTEIAVPALTEGQAHPFNLTTPITHAVAGWRYKKK